MIPCTVRRSFLALMLVLVLSFAALAQGQSPTTASGQQFKPEQLEALAAPIALYPDSLLATTLMASTYPLEVVRADRWVTENKKLTADAQKMAVDKQPWDDSVKSLVATPSVLSMMASKLDWTQSLGDAVLAQKPDVMDAIQRLRARAQASDKLQTTPQQIVTVKQLPAGTGGIGGGQVIAIDAALADTVSVPYYDPTVVYGGWPYSDYPPYSLGYPSYIGARLVATGIAFGTGYLVGRWVSGNRIWGGGLNWGNRNIVANRTTDINALGNNWQHNPAHRQGVRYSNASVQQQFGSNIRSGAQQRMDFRGRGGDQVLNPGGGTRAGANANRNGTNANRGGANIVNRAGANTQRRNANARPVQTARTGPRNGNVNAGRTVWAQAVRGQASFGGARASVGMGGGGFLGGGRGGGRRSDITLKHDVVRLGWLDEGLGFYRFSYNGSDKAYVGVIAQEVQRVMPDAVMRGRDGYLRVFYDKLGLKFETYAAWVASGARVPAVRLH